MRRNLRSVPTTLLVLLENGCSGDHPGDMAAADAPEQAADGSGGDGPASDGMAAGADASGGDGAVTDGSAAAGDDGGVCNQICPACPVGQSCLVTDQTEAVCLPDCHTDDDCAHGSRCMSVIRNVNMFPAQPPFTYDPPVCVSWTAHQPPLCPGVWSGAHCDIFAPAHCQDEMTLIVETDAPGSCGHWYQHCSNGCTAAPADAGPTEMAHCQ